MKAKILKKLTLWTILIQFPFPIICSAQSMPSDYWVLQARFKVLKIKENPIKYRSAEYNTENENNKCYLITVEITDTNHFQELVDIFGDKKSYKGTRFSIVSIDGTSACNNKIRINDTVLLTINLWSRIWVIGDNLPRGSFWLFEICGYTIPNDMLCSQPMQAKELDGLCYSINKNKE